MATSNDTPELKQCSKCGSLKPHTNQYFRVRDGFTEKKCRECLNAYRNSQRRTPETRLKNPVDSEGYKVCGKCGERKPYTTEFFHQRGDGLTSRCKVCRNAYHRSYSCGRRDQNAYNAKTWRSKNKERNRDNQRRWRQNNPEKDTAKRLKYIQSDTERFRAQKRAVEANRRARMKSVGGTYSVDDIRLIYRSQKGLCWWCGKPVGSVYHVDHRIPLSRGGSNAPENLCISCPTCNNQKYNKLPQEWNGRLL